MHLRRWSIITVSLSLLIASISIARTFRRADANATISNSASTHVAVQALKDLGTPPDGLEFERKLVRNAPFSATQFSETTTITQSDGTASSETVTSTIYRDRKGRTRRDVFGVQSGGSAGAPATPTRSVINDPVSGFSYTLDHTTHIARRSIYVGERNLPEDSSTQPGDSVARQNVLPVPLTAGVRNSSLRQSANDAFSGRKAEPLGTREIEHVLSEGTRVTMTVPANQAGNEQSFEIVVERWYSPEIKAVVLVQRTDPRKGNSTYRLTNIERGEPAAAFFSVPSEYKIQP